MSLRQKFRDFWRRRYYFIVGSLLVFLFLLAFLWPRVVFTIDSGHAGVLFRRFFGGTVTDSVRDEGLQIISPWNKLIIYDVRVQQVEHSFSVISSNGLEVAVTVSIRFKPKVELLGVLHKEVGPDYLQKIVIPEVQALVREVFGQFTPEEMYTTKRSLIEETLQGALGEVGEKYVALDDLLIKSILLPPGLQVAIESKLVEEQRSLEMKFRIERERQEADRKVIEAEGVDQSQEIIARSLTEPLLRYKGIEATVALASSANAKLVVMGSPSGGLPLLFDAGFGGLSTNYLAASLTNRVVTNRFQNTRALPVPRRPMGALTRTNFSAKPLAEPPR